MIYIHEKSGVKYKLLYVANEGLGIGLDDSKWVETAVYRSEKDGKIYARPMHEFKDKFVKCFTECSSS